MPRFSIIIPFLGDINLFDDTLASVLRYRPDETQVIVAHDGQYVDRFGLQNEVDFAVTGRKAQLIRLFNCGVRKSTGDIVALVRPGIELDESWHLPVLRALSDPDVGSLSPIIVSPLKPSKVVAAGVTKEFGFCRKLVGHNSSTAPRKLKNISPLGPTSWMALYRKSVLHQIGTCDEMLDPLYLDLDLALAISKLGYRCVFEPECVVTIDRTTPLIRESTMAHGRSAQRAMRRHAADASLGTTLLTITAELIKSPMRPWLLQHTMQRMGAGRLADIDRHFADKISQTSRQNQWDRSGRHAA